MLSIDGLRIDTVKHVRKDFWPAFVASSGVYTVGEVLDGGVSYVAPYTDVMDGILDYVTYYQLTYAFQATNGSIADLVTAHDELKTGVNDTTLLGKFLDSAFPLPPFYPSPPSCLLFSTLGPFVQVSSSENPP